MGRFRAPKQREELEDASPALDRKIAAFAAGAAQRLESVPDASELDPKAKPTNGINLRLNDYELAMVRRVAVAQDRSIQKTIKRFLIPALEQADQAE